MGDRPDGSETILRVYRQRGVCCDGFWILPTLSPRPIHRPPIVSRPDRESVDLIHRRELFFDGSRNQSRLCFLPRHRPRSFWTICNIFAVRMTANSFHSPSRFSGVDHDPNNFRFAADLIDMSVLADLSDEIVWKPASTISTASSVSASATGRRERIADASSFGFELELDRECRCCPNGRGSSNRSNRLAAS